MTFKAVSPATKPAVITSIAPISETFIFALDSDGQVWIAFKQPDGDTEWRHVGPPGEVVP